MEQHSHHKLVSCHMSTSTCLCWFEWLTQHTLIVFMAQAGHSSPHLACLWLPAWRAPHFLIVIVWFVIFCWCRCGGVLACVWWSGRSWTIGAETEASQHVRSLSPQHRMDSYSPPTHRGKYAQPMPPRSPISFGYHCWKSLHLTPIHTKVI